MRRILVISAEDSSSIYALNVIRELGNINKNFRFFGTGAEFLRDSMELLYEAKDLSFVGFEEPGKIFKILGIYWRLKEALRGSDGAIFFDYPGMNLKLAGYAKGLGKPVCYYCAPQVWAWWTKRAEKMARMVDRLVVLFPFEEEFFNRYGVNAKFFGHPLCLLLKDYIGLEKDDYFLLLPGSRRSEVISLLSTMVETSRLIRKYYRNRFRFYLIKAKSLPEELFETIPSWIEMVPFENRYEYMARARYAISASGTATLELALLGVYTFVVYRVRPWVYSIARKLVRVRNISIVNILLGREAFPEYLQNKAHPDLIFEDFRRISDEYDQLPYGTFGELFKLLYREDHFIRVGEFFNEVLS
ncbi:MAG: lipid-A-disaccharide synthase [Thermosulfidibacteraceae bacterium]